MSATIYAVNKSLQEMFLRFVACCAIVVALVYLFKVPLHVNPTTVALTFLVAVLIVSARWGLRSSLFLAVIGTAAFNYFFFPRWDFHDFRCPELDRFVCVPCDGDHRQSIFGTRAATDRRSCAAPARGGTTISIQRGTADLRKHSGIVESASATGGTHVWRDRLLPCICRKRGHLPFWP